MQRISLLNIAHNLVKAKLNPGDIVIDATVGNGHDTFFLLQQIQPAGWVYGFDCQQSALNSAGAKIRQAMLSDCLTLIHGCHSAMAEKIPKQHHGGIRAIMFNLGYLPGSDKAVITKAESTIAALTVASELLSVSGIITVVAYPGHSGGEREMEAVKCWCDRLDTGYFNVRTLFSSEHKDSAPRLFVIEKTEKNPTENSFYPSFNASIVK